jgi:hypothetical protein
MCFISLLYHLLDPLVTVLFGWATTNKQKMSQFIRRLSNQQLFVGVWILCGWFMDVGQGEIPKPAEVDEEAGRPGWIVEILEGLIGYKNI